MSIFKEIRPEEIESGFQQPEPGYEGFILKPEESYPGEFPIFKDEIIPDEQFEEQVPSESVPEVAEGIIDAANLEGNIWGVFDQEQPLPTTSEQEPQVNTFEEQQASVITSEETIKIEAKETTDEFADLSIPFTEETKSEPKTKLGVISIDEELKKLLQEELEKKKAKSSEQVSQSDDEPIEPISELTEKPKFVPVEEMGGNVKFIDMMALDPNRVVADLTIDHNEEPVETIREKKSRSKEKAEKIKLEKKEKNEKKQRKVLVWLLSSVAGILILSTISYFAFNYFLKSVDKSTNDTPLAQIDTLNRKKEINNEEQHKDSLHQQIQQKVDTTKVVAVKPITETQPITDSKTELKQNETPKPFREEPIKTQSTTPQTISKQKSAKITHFYTPQKNKPIPSQKQEKTADIASITPQPKQVETSIPPVEKQVYTIQVYATPSFEDAEFWLQKLTSMKINDVYISTQKIRDVIWYRVRFGKFTNRQQALDAAKQFGFSQTWIDRIQ